MPRATWFVPLALVPAVPAAAIPEFRSKKPGLENAIDFDSNKAARVKGMITEGKMKYEANKIDNRLCVHLWFEFQIIYKVWIYIYVLTSYYWLRFSTSYILYRRRRRPSKGRRSDKDVGNSLLSHRKKGDAHAGGNEKKREKIFLLNWILGVVVAVVKIDSCSCKSSLVPNLMATRLYIYMKLQSTMKTSQKEVRQ